MVIWCGGGVKIGQRRGNRIFFTGTESWNEDIMQIRISRHFEPALACSLLKFSLQIFEKEINALTVDEYAEVYMQACHELILHEKILLSEEACGVVIPESLVRRTYETLQVEHGGDENFAHYLQQQNLTSADYLAALGNDLKVEAILARVAFQAGPVRHEEIEAYYERHRDSFGVSEQRSARHILISTENRYQHLPEDSLPRRISRLHARLRCNPQTFSQEAFVHSDCATAMYGGDLGRVGPGELCPALDQALFQLAAGEISPIIRTTQGFHILYCEAVHSMGPVCLAEVYNRIRQHLTREKRTKACRTWLMSLFSEIKGTLK